tara:strand:- start:5013 stop:6191 length:1179 start_codon:yes stop_codon:yes gene_type:complete
MEAVLKNIEKHDDDTNRRAIDALVSKLKRDKKMDFLSRLCEIIYEKKFSSETIESLLEPFDPEEDLDKVIITICRCFLATREEIKYIVQTSKNISDIKYMLTLLFEEKRNTEYQTAAENLLYCYDRDLTNEDINSLLENLIEYEQYSRDSNVDDIACYLKNKRVFDREKYMCPYWVSKIEGENIGLLATVPLGESEDSGEEVRFDKIIDSSSSFFYQLLPRKERYDEDTSAFSLTDLPENIKSSIQTFLKASTDSEIAESGVKIGSPERVWGPKNDIQGMGCCSGPGGEGPCRMLQCECLESEETEDNGAYDYKGEITWFQGRCDSCRKFILDISHALRFPNNHGGWKGCYCSFECLKADPPHKVTKEENILLGIMKANIDRGGIMDRSSFC